MKSSIAFGTVYVEGYMMEGGGGELGCDYLKSSDLSKNIDG
jgi:hypothetical protein